MTRSLILTDEEEEQKKKDYFEMPNDDFTRKWRCSIHTAVIQYGRKSSKILKRRSKLSDTQIMQGIDDYKTMSMPEFCEKYNIVPKTARTIF